MKELLIFAGTTEGRKLSECLLAAELAHTICVATEYGEIVLKEHPLRKIHCGRMDQEEIRKFLQTGDFCAVVDATHPYAELITENIKQAMQGMDIAYMRLKREEDAKKVCNEEGVRYFETNEECAKTLDKTEGNILLTTGSKELAKYCISENLKRRLFVRVLPSSESLAICAEQGILGKQIIAMQGPFTLEMNEAIIQQYGISCLVTKQSGTSGGYQEKRKAAKRVGIPVFVIGHPKEESGYSFLELCRVLEELYGQKIPINGHFKIILAGIGMGNKNNLTKEVQEAIENADILLGAERMVEAYPARIEKRSFYQAKQIIPYLKELQEKKLLTEERNVVILFSGDSGFYSGCQSLYHALWEEVREGRLKASIHILPGISSVAYLAAAIGESYQDAGIFSMHGKKLCNLAKRIKSMEKMYFLMSGVQDVNRLGKILVEAGMTECQVVAGYQMSYGNQKIRSLTPEECCGWEEEGLYTCFLQNPYAKPKELTHGISDEKFIRDRIPMTKEEVREVSICKLKLNKQAVIYDIGSGTGSLAVEMAGLSDDIEVYAIERKKEAILLIEKNKEKFQLENITVAELEAPEGLEELKPATHAFIGGSGGRLKEIIVTLYRINPRMRVVINAISMETIAKMKEIVSLYPIENEEIVQLQVSRAKKTGQYHLMQAENPVWICAFNFHGE